MENVDSLYLLQLSRSEIFSHIWNNEIGTLNFTLSARHHYYVSNQEILEITWRKFEDTHEKICESTKLAHKYFTDSTLQ